MHIHSCATTWHCEPLRYNAALRAIALQLMLNIMKHTVKVRSKNIGLEV